MMAKAELWNMRPLGTNPARGHERESEPQRTRVLSEVEIVALGAALRARDAVARAKHKRFRPSPVTALIRFLLLTGVRVGEALSMEIADLDLEAGVWRLNKHKTMKTAGARNVALPSHAIAALQSVTTVLGNPYVFVGTRIKDKLPLDDPRLPWEEIRKAAGLVDVHIHDLRRTFASTGIGMGIPELRIATLLGHAAGSTTAIYARVVDPVQAQDVERIAGRLYGLLSGAPGAVSAAG
jgi:integrase